MSSSEPRVLQSTTTIGPSPTSSVQPETGGNLDPMSFSIASEGPTLQHLDLVAPGGRLATIGLQGGRHAQLDMGLLLKKRIQVMGSTLRARTAEEKGHLIDALWNDVGELFEQGTLRPHIFDIVDGKKILLLRTTSLAPAVKHFGKIVLDMRNL